MSIWRWAADLDAVPESARITLGEGNTPVVKSRRLGPSVGLANLYLKLELCNPTGSYKDRYAAAAVSHMIAAKQTRCVATSSGNTGASLAAYCSIAGIDCLIAIVETAPEGKLQQMLAYGARLYRVRGFGLDPAITAETMRTVNRLGSQPGSATQVSAYAISPAGMSGVQTISYELAEQFDQPIDHVFTVAGGGGLTLATARGFEVLTRTGRLKRSPRVECVQPAGNDTIATPLCEGTPAREVQCTTRISGLQVPTVLDGNRVIEASRGNGGTGHTVSDDEVWDAQKRLAREEGIFCEPAGAAALAGALRAAREGRLAADAVVVCLVTSSGFKDPQSVQRMLEGTSCPVVSVEEFQKL